MSVTTDPAMLIVNVSLAVVGFLTIFLFQAMWKEQKEQSHRIGKLETHIAIIRTLLNANHDSEV